MGITGKDLTAPSYRQGPWLGVTPAHVKAKSLEGAALAACPVGPRVAGPPQPNIDAVTGWMRMLMGTPAEVAGDRIGARRSNEHSFVFRGGNLYYRTKGATALPDGFLRDSAGVRIVPLTMADRVLLAVRGRKQAAVLGCTLHGTRRGDARLVADETCGIEARSRCGRIDTSKPRSVCKPAAKACAQTEASELDGPVDEIVAGVSIMAGDCEDDARWRRKVRAKAAGAGRA